MIILLLFALLSISLADKNTVCIPSGIRKDCGYVGIDQTACESKGCCWNAIPSDGLPWCYYSNPAYMGYQVKKSLNDLIDLVGYDFPAYYSEDISQLSAQFQCINENTLRIKIYDPNNNRFEIPESLVPQPTLNNMNNNNNCFNDNPFQVTYTNKPFGFAVYRNDDKSVLFNTTASSKEDFNGLIFEDNFISLSLKLNSNLKGIYGIGENIKKNINALKIYKNDIMALWNRDTPSPVNENMYGSQPFFLAMIGNKAFGAFMRNSNGMDISITSSSILTYHMLGGVIDLYLFAGPSPEDVIQQYHSLIGTTQLPAYWSLGYHQCRYGYKSLNEVKTVLENFKKNAIPLDTLWLDIDYMDKFKDFTYDPEHFSQSEVAEFVQQLHNEGRRFVTIVDPGILIEKGYPAYDRGIEKGIFVLNKEGRPFQGKVWPGYTYFPDFLNPKTYEYWKQEISEFRDLAPVDGLWIDMNEPANFCNGECSENFKNESLGDAGRYLPPYLINNCGNLCPLNTKTLDTTAVHYTKISHYDSHNLYGHAESIMTSKALEQLTRERPFVLTRSNFASTGHHAAHWLGDNWSIFDSMKYSIEGVLNYNMFGINMVGSDICGFIGYTTKELCGRWTQLGSFYPFTRNHNSIDSPSQEPYLWPEVAQIAKKFLTVKYQLLPYYYTLFFRAHIKGGTVLRPLFFEFPNDENVFSIDSQFMVGSSLLISPVLQASAQSVEAYIPDKAIWYDFWTGIAQKDTGYQTLSAPFDTMPVHLRGGSILPMHLLAKLNSSSLTTTAARKEPFQLLIAPDAMNTAFGEVILDDGVSLGEPCGESNPCTLISYTFTQNKLGGVVSAFKYDPKVFLSEITFFGIPSRPSDITLNGASLSPSQIHFDGAKSVLSITDLSIKMQDNFIISWK